MKKWICALLALMMLGCFALAENTLNEGGYSDGDYMVVEGSFFESIWVRLGIAAVVALIIAFVRVNAMKAKLLTAHKRSGASDYAQEGSFELGVKQDHFLYERTERRRIQTSQSGAQGGGRGPGGGSSRGGGANRIR